MCYDIQVDNRERDSLSTLPPNIEKRTVRVIRTKRRVWPLALCAFVAGFLTVYLLDLDSKLFSLGISFPSTEFQRGYVPLSEMQLYSAVISSSRRYGVPPELTFAVISAESHFRHRIRSRRGAMGLMQLTRETVLAFGVKDPFDPAQNIEAGTSYLSRLIREYDGQLELALAAYNAGPGAVKRFKGIPPYPETRNYVKRVMNEYKRRLRVNGEREIKLQHP